MLPLVVFFFLGFLGIALEDCFLVSVEDDIVVEDGVAVDVVMGDMEDGVSVGDGVPVEDGIPVEEDITVSKILVKLVCA